VHEGDVKLRKARQDVGLNIKGVKPLVGNAIPVENHPVPGLERKRGLSLGGDRDEEAEDKGCEANPFHYGWLLEDPAIFTSE
jgi:hypothetical protein